LVPFNPVLVVLKLSKAYLHVLVRSVPRWEPIKMPIPSKKWAEGTSNAYRGPFFCQFCGTGSCARRKVKVLRQKCWKCQSVSSNEEINCDFNQK